MLAFDVNPNRSKKKGFLVAFTIIVFLTLAAYGLDWALSPGFNQVSKCSLDGAKDQKIIAEKLRVVESKTDRLAIFCTEDTKAITKLTDCYNNAKKQNPLGVSLFFLIPKYKNVVAETINSHNQACPNSPLVSPNL